MKEMNRAKKYFATPEAAEYLGISPRTLERWRLEGNGPAFFKFGGRVLYSPAVLDTYIEKSTYSSTSATSAS